MNIVVIIVSTTEAGKEVVTCILKMSSWTTYVVQRAEPLGDRLSLIWSGAGPDDCHPDLMSSYRSELGGLTAVYFFCID